MDIQDCDPPLNSGGKSEMRVGHALLGIKNEDSFSPGQTRTPAKSHARTAKKSKPTMASEIPKEIATRLISLDPLLSYIALSNSRSKIKVAPTTRAVEADCRGHAVK
jgi:hypothetical protein